MNYLLGETGVSETGAGETEAGETEAGEETDPSQNMILTSRRKLLDRRRLKRYFYMGTMLVLVSLIFFFSSTYLNSTGLSSPDTSITIPKKKCSILVMIISTPRNFKNRDVLRYNSYLGYPWVYNRTDVDFAHVFILGKTNDNRVNELAREEVKQYGDVAIGDFEDSYDNLSEKVIWGFKYVLRNFDFKFSIKVDEDSFVNMAYLAAHLRQVDDSALQSYYAGKPRQGDLTVPKFGKFKVEDKEMKDTDKYVQYNLGGGYILSKHSMQKILAAHKSKAIEVVAWEDVYIGMLAYLVDIKPIRIYHYYVSKFYPFCTDVKTILLHHTPPDLQAKMLNYYNREGKYCPQDTSENEVLQLINSQEIIDWRDY